MHWSRALARHFAIEFLFVLQIVILCDPFTCCAAGFRRHCTSRRLYAWPGVERGACAPTHPRAAPRVPGARELHSGRRQGHERRPPPGRRRRRPAAARPAGRPAAAAAAVVGAGRGSSSSRFSRAHRGTQRGFAIATQRSSVVRTRNSLVPMTGMARKPDARKSTFFNGFWDFRGPDHRAAVPPARERPLTARRRRKECKVPGHPPHGSTGITYDRRLCNAIESQ